MQENLSDLIRDEKDSPEKDEIKIYEKTPKRILILIGKIISVVGCFCSILGIVYFVLKIFEYGFYYLFLIGSLVSIAGLGVSVYGCYKLWKKNKNPKTFVDSWQKTENAAELLDEKTILLEDEDDRTVLLLEEPIGRLVPKNPEQKDIDQEYCHTQCKETHLLMIVQFHGYDYLDRYQGYDKKDCIQCNK